MSSGFRLILASLALALSLALVVLVPAGARAADPAPTRKIVLTIDDLPGRLRQRTLRGFQDVNRKVVAALKAAGVPAIGFVNEKPFHVRGERDARVEILRGWLDAGFPLGNHTFSHKSLSRTPLLQYQDDVLRGEVITRQLMEERQLPLKWFRHPYTHSGPTLEVRTAFETFLAERGYQVAPFTFDHGDWVFNTVYEQAVADRDRAMQERIKKEHIDHFDRVLTYYEEVSRQVFGREIPQILLTHVNRINAERYPQLLALLKRRGYAVVTLEEALQDPAYATADTFAGKDGMSWLFRFARTLGKKVDAGPSPRIAPDLIERYKVIDAKIGGNDDL